MTNLKTQLIKLGSTNPELRPHIQAVIGALEPTRKVASKDVLDYIIPESRFWKVVDKAPEYLQNFMMDIRSELGEALALKGSEERALNRLIQLVSNPPRDERELANQLGKIGIELGLKPDFL